MTDPITPPPELVEEWMRTAPHPSNETEHYHYITLCAAQWGADQELEACCECLDSWGDIHNSYGYELASDLRAARRPNPPSLKEQALKQLVDLERVSTGDYSAIRRALEALDD